ncbi:hypothetical protein ES288_A11G286600v1 [Gossypium darwinii]|uniref:3'-5' exonuclease domain-containing protein n=1 Tax=Gossypium darwinii TaxID=34276 RepID=A0A5D2ERB3_GOSDA|nr:hypothetical protein ES288_A11G286600v1 [Gossypium darwinii]
MGSVKQLMGDEFVMVDRGSFPSEVLSCRDEGRMRSCVLSILVHMILHDDMVAGLDITWDTCCALLAIFSLIGCVLITSDGRLECIKKLLSNKDITFVGVHMKENVKKMRTESYVEISNAVDVGELAADVLHQPLRGIGVRRLATEVLKVPFKPRPLFLSWGNLNVREPENLTKNQIEYVATDAYAAYKIGKKLLGF